MSNHEATQLKNAKNSLAKSIRHSENNIALLLAANKKLNEQLLDKTKSERNEMKVARFRRCKADHRWVLENKDLSQKSSKKSSSSK